MKPIQQKSKELFCVLLVASLNDFSDLTSTGVICLTCIVTNRGSFFITSYTKSGVNGSPYCSSSLSLSRNLNCSTVVAESMTEYSRMNIILLGSVEFQNYKIVSNAHSINQRCVAFETVCSIFPNLVQEIIKRGTKYKNLKHLRVC